MVEARRAHLAEWAFEGRPNPPAAVPGPVGETERLSVTKASACGRALSGRGKSVKPGGTAGAELWSLMPLSQQRIFCRGRGFLLLPGPYAEKGAEILWKTKKKSAF